MRRAWTRLAVALCLLANPVAAQDFSGTWYGRLEGFSSADPSRTLVVANQGGNLVCAFGWAPQPAQCSLNGGALDLVTRTNSKVHLVRSGDTLEGTLTQAAGHSYHLRMSHEPTILGGAAATVPAWAIGTWHGRLRGPNAHWWSSFGQDLELVIRPTGQCALSPPGKVYQASCTYSKDGVKLELSGIRVDLRHGSDKLDGYLEGYSTPRAFLTMSK